MLDRLRCIWLALGLTMVSALPAAEVADLYQAEVPVTSRGEEDRAAALTEALAHVLVKVSGRSRGAWQESLADALAGPGRYVQQYRYGTAVQGPDATALADMTLTASFDSLAVDQLLTSAGIPIWGRTRPLVLVWLALEEDGRRRLVGAGEGPSIEEGARRRGLPVVLPLLDLEDQAALGVSDVWAGFADRIRAASSRYRADALLVGRAHRIMPDLWELRWELLTDAGAEAWRTRDRSLAKGLIGGVEAAADALSARFAMAASEAGDGRLELTVSGVDSLADYARLLTYLEGLQGVDSSGPVLVEPGRVRFRLSTRLDRATLERGLALGRVLRPAVSGGGADGREFELYR